MKQFNIGVKNQELFIEGNYVKKISYSRSARKWWIPFGQKNKQINWV